MRVKNRATRDGFRVASLLLVVLAGAAWAEANGRIPAMRKGASDEALPVTEDSLAFAGAGFPHHGAVGYDLEKTITLNGTATSFDWENPHCLLHMDVKESGGKVERWTIEMAPPTMLSRRGWRKDSIKPGDQVTVDIHPAKNGIPLGIGSSSSYMLKTVVNGKALPTQ